jgi:hypothetical protein
VSLPERWSCFNTIKTGWPGLIFSRAVPFIQQVPLLKSHGHSYHKPAEKITESHTRDVHAPQRV